MSNCASGPVRTRIPIDKAKAARLQAELTAIAGYRGWAVVLFKDAILSNRFAMPFNGVQRITVSTGNILRLKYVGLAAMLQAAEVVLQGNSDKEVAAPQVVTAMAATTVTLTARAVGMLVRFSDNWNSADYRPFPLAVSGTGVTSFTMTIYPCVNFLDLAVLFISNNAGEATLVGPTNGQVQIAADRARAGAYLSGESITLRDLL